MKIQPYIDKLNNSTEYKDFNKKHSDAFMMAGFFVLDFESGANMHQLDFYVPSKKKIAAFTMDGGVKVQLLKTLNQKVPEKLDMKTKIDLDALKGILQDEMKNRGMTEDIKKIIAIIQNIDGKKVWNLNCVLSGMGLLKAHIEDQSKTVLKMEKSSIMDYIQKMPQGALQKMQNAMPQGQQPGKEVQAQAGVQSASQEPQSSAVRFNNADPKQKLEQLGKLQKALEMEKQKIEQEAIEAEKNSVKKVSKKAKVTKKKK